VSPVRYELDFYIPEDDILHSHLSFLFPYLLLLLLLLLLFRCPPRSYARFGAYPNIYLKNCNKCNHEYINRVTAQPGTDARVRVFSAGLLARSQVASGRSCDRPTRSRFSVVFLGPRANAELAKFHVALYALYAALPMVISKFSSNAAR
jgi:hypothetical protein